MFSLAVDGGTCNWSIQGANSDTWRTSGRRCSTKGCMICQPTWESASELRLQIPCCHAWQHRPNCGSLTKSKWKKFYCEDGFPSDILPSPCHHLWLSWAPTQLRCEKKKRLMSGEEQLAALGYPCNRELAEAAGVEPWINHQMFERVDPTIWGIQWTVCNHQISL